jgi:hypothetical protein
MKKIVGFQSTLKVNGGYPQLFQLTNSGLDLFWVTAGVRYKTTVRRSGEQGKGR